MAILKYAHIVKDELMSGSARIAGTRIRVRDIVEKYIIASESPEIIAQEFRISLAEVHEALAYYYEHTEEIRKEIKEDREFIDNFMKEIGKHEISS